MNILKQSLKRIVLVFAILGLSAGVANATIIGGFGISGTYSTGVSTVTLDSATSTGGTDSFSSLSFGLSGTSGGMLNYDAFSPVVNILLIDGWQLDLTSLVVDSASTPDRLKFRGSAWLTDTGGVMGKTAAEWTFSAQNASSYSMTVSTISVDEPVIWLLLLAGIIMIASQRRVLRNM